MAERSVTKALMDTAILLGEIKLNKAGMKYVFVGKYGVHVSLEPREFMRVMQVLNIRLSKIESKTEDGTFTAQFTTRQTRFDTSIDINSPEARSMLAENQATPRLAVVRSQRLPAPKTPKVAGHLF